MNVAIHMHLLAYIITSDQIPMSVIDCNATNIFTGSNNVVHFFRPTSLPVHIRAIEDSHYVYYYDL